MTRLRPWILAAALLVAVANYITANAQQMQETVFIAGDRPVNAEQVWQNLQSAVQQGGVAVRRQLKILILSAFGAVQPALAQDEGPPVPLQKSAYHVPVFSNEFLNVLRVSVPSQRSSGYHIHSLDQFRILIEEADLTGQVLGERPTAPYRDPRGTVTYTAYSKKPVTHQLINVGPTAFHNIVITLPETQPGRFAPAPREVLGYTQVLDNERIRAWRLVLEPGQSAGLISQQAPGMRVIVQGGEIVESVPGERERGMLLRLGDFYWQEPGGKRAVRNIGTSLLEGVELELK